MTEQTEQMPYEEWRLAAIKVMNEKCGHSGDSADYGPEYLKDYWPDHTPEEAVLEDLSYA